MVMKSEYFECKCDSNEHLLRFVLDEEENELYTDVYLNHWRPWYKRALIGIKYIFGYKCVYGAWDCTLLKDEDISRLRDLCDKVIENETT